MKPDHSLVAACENTIPKIEALDGCLVHKIRTWICLYYHYCEYDDVKRADEYEKKLREKLIEAKLKLN